MVTMKGRRGWGEKSSGESLITMGWLPTSQTRTSLVIWIQFTGIKEHNM
jgi:hypothetical protein